MQQRELSRTEALHPVAAAGFPANRVQRDASVGQYRTRLSALTPQHGPQPREQLRDLEWLQQIIVRPHIKAGDTILQGLARCNDDHGHLVVLAAQAAQHIESVPFWQTKIQQHGLAARPA